MIFSRYRPLGTIDTASHDEGRIQEELCGLMMDYHGEHTDWCDKRATFIASDRTYSPDGIIERICEQQSAAVGELARSVFDSLLKQRSPESVAEATLVANVIRTSDSPFKDWSDVSNWHLDVPSEDECCHIVRIGNDLVRTEVWRGFSFDPQAVGLFGRPFSVPNGAAFKLNFPTDYHRRARGARRVGWSIFFRLDFSR